MLARRFTRRTGFALWARLAWFALGRLHQSAISRFDHLDHIGLHTAITLHCCRLRLWLWLLGFARSALCIALGTFAVALGLTFAVFTLLRFAPLVDLFLRSAQHTQIVLCMLREILGRNTITRKLRIARKLLVFVDNLLRCPTYLALGAGTVEHAVGNISPRLLRAIAVIILPRTGF